LMLTVAWNWIGCHLRSDDIIFRNAIFKVKKGQSLLS
jgi:hypothetical protein